MTYLEPIFSNVYWKGSNEFKLFSYADSNWKKLTKLINKDFSLRKLALQEKKHIAILREDNGIFEELNKSVEQLLTSKR